MKRNGLTRAVWLWALALFAPALHALDFEACSLNGSAGNGNLHAECATWQQPLDRNDTAAGTIELRVVRLNATALEPAADALTIINGGPGGSSIDLLVDLAGVFQSFTRERDVVVIDQRGTGRSAPLSCAALTDTAEDLNTEDTRELTVECLADLEHDPRFFTTSSAVEDLEHLRETLGYAQWSLYGVSYGTRVVQHYAQRYPDRTRALIIDGVVPLSAALGPQIPAHSQHTLDQTLARCAQDTACAAAFPDLGSDLAALSDLLRTAPVPLTLAHPITGEATTLDLTYNHLAAWLRFSLYAPEGAAVIPVTISQAATGRRYVPIAANALRLLHNITTAVNYGMHNSVICTEDMPFVDLDEAALAELDATYLGREMFETLETICAVWPEGYRHDDIKTNPAHDLPTLVLSGEFDPITPPAWGDEAAASLTNSVHVTAPGQGHGVIARGCIPRLALEFVESPLPAEVDASCVQHLSAFPFFVSPMGPPP